MDEAEYGREEVEALLRRTAEIEAERRNGEPAPGLSLADLELIVEESGLDPEALRAAAAEPAEPRAVAAALPPAPVPGAGGGRLHHERSLDGELAEAELARLVELTGTHLNLPGDASRTDKGWSWDVRRGARRVNALAESQAGRTRVLVSEDLRGLAAKLRLTASGSSCAAGLAFGLAFGAAAESTLAHAMIHGVLGGILGLTGGLVIAKVMFGRLRLARELQLRRVIAAMEAQARERLGEDVEGLPGRSEGKSSRSNRRRLRG